MTQLLPLLDGIPPLRGRHGRPLRRPKKVYADRGYDHDKYPRLLRTRYERRADIHQALLSLACSVICLRHLIAA